MTAADYVAHLLAFYRALPATSSRTGPADRRLASQLHARGVPLETVRAAFVLATARRLLTASAPPTTVRSFAYFLPVVNELLACPVDPIYIDHLERRLSTLTATSRSAASPSPTSRPVSCSPQVQKRAVR